MNDIKKGDMVMAIVDYYDIKEGAVLVVDEVTPSGCIKVVGQPVGTRHLDPVMFEKIPHSVGTQYYQQPQEEPSEMTIESLLKLAKEYAEEAAESQRKSEELYEKADKMYKRLRGNAEEQVVEEDMSDPSNWRAGDIVEFTRESVHMTTGGYYYLQEYKHGEAVDDCGDVKVIDDEGDVRVMFSAYDFKWHSRPSKETK